VRSADRNEADRLRKKNERLEAELAKTRTALDIGLFSMRRGAVCSDDPPIGIHH
jgi:hypothetical protein